MITKIRAILGQARNRQLLENIGSLYLLQGLNYLIPMAVVPFLVRALGIEQYGIVSVAQSFSQYFVLLTDYGFNFTATRSLIQARSDSASASRIFSNVMAVKVMLMIVGGIVLYCVILFLPKVSGQEKYYVAGYLVVVGNVFFPTWFFQGIEQMRYISGIVGVGRILSAIGLFVWVRGPEDAVLALILLSSVQLFAAVVGLWLCFSRFKIKLLRPSFAEIRTSLRSGWHLFVSQAAVSLYTNTNVLLVGYLAGPIQAGYFSAAEKLVRAIQGLIVPFSQAVFPHMNKLMMESREAAWRFAKASLRWMGAGCLVLSALCLFFAKQIVLIVFGPSAAPSIAVFRWISMLPFLIVVSNILGIQIMIPCGLDKQFSRILIWAGVLNIVLAVPLTHFHGGAGAGASVLMTETVVTVSMLVVLKRERRLITL